MNESTTSGARKLGSKSGQVTGCVSQRTVAHITSVNMRQRKHGDEVSPFPQAAWAADCESKSGMI